MFSYNIKYMQSDSIVRLRDSTVRVINSSCVCR